MTYRGHVENGRITLDEPADLPEGAEVDVQVVQKKVRITSPTNPKPLAKIKPLKMPGGSLADELIRDRR